MRKMREGKGCKEKEEQVYNGNIKGRKLAVAFVPFTASILEYVSCSNPHLHS